MEAKMAGGFWSKSVPSIRASRSAVSSDLSRRVDVFRQPVKSPVNMFIKQAVSVVRSRSSVFMENGKPPPLHVRVVPSAKRRPTDFVSPWHGFQWKSMVGPC